MTKFDEVSNVVHKRASSDSIRDLTVLDESIWSPETLSRTTVKRTRNTYLSDVTEWDRYLSDKWQMYVSKVFNYVSLMKYTKIRGGWFSQFLLLRYFESFLCCFSIFFSRIFFSSLEQNRRSIWESHILSTLIHVPRPFTTPSVPVKIQSSL